MPAVTIEHRTTYTYNAPVQLGGHRLMVRPLPKPGLWVVDSQLLLSARSQQVERKRDGFGNIVEEVKFAGPPVSEVTFLSRFTVHHTPRDIGEIAWQSRSYGRDAPDESPLAAQARNLHRPDPHGLVWAWARETAGCYGGAGLDELMAMNNRIYQEFIYASRTDQGTQDPARTLELRTGSCRDFALLFIEAARCLGIPAVFASGYLYNDADEDALIGGRSTHGWAQAWLPGAGWVDFDPTNGLVGDRNLVQSAITLDPHQNIPILGSYLGTKSDFNSMHVDVSFHCRPFSPQGTVTADFHQPHRMAFASQM